MLLPHIKEREYRFKLALRMGLPIFALVLTLISHTFVSTFENLDTIFFIELILVLVFSIYFILYLIYNGFEVKITEAVTKIFTREYLYKYLKKEISKKDYTLILISVDNIDDINSRYGIKNGDKIRYEVVKYITDFLQSKGISKFPIGHINTSNFLIGLRGSKNEYKTFLEMFCIKSDGFKVDDIEVKISSAINDTGFSKEIDHLIENLFELKLENINLKQTTKTDEMNPSLLEALVISAIKEKRFILMTQDVYEEDKSTIKECFVKLKTADNKTIYPKSYMKVINRIGLTFEYDLMIIKKVMELCNEINKEIFAISISPTSLRNPLFILKIKELLKNNPNSVNKTMFILSESEYFSQIDRYNSILSLLKSHGVLIAIDRLGAIHTSFLYLRELDIDVVRFDSLYSKDFQNQKYKSIINGFNVIAHNNKIKTWMKLIEEIQTKELAKELDVDYLQGKYLSDLKKIYEN